jgi:7-cyano-7-deazaguanine reductase
MENNLKHLGQGGSYAVFTDKYDPSLLQVIPREEARRDWNIKGDEFVGVDVWHCHEATFLLDNGLPIAGTLKLIYDSNSISMVESKSIKLFLNSFDMCKMGSSIHLATKNYLDIIRDELSKILGVVVKVNFFYNGEDSSLVMNNPAMGFEDLYTSISRTELEGLEISDYTAQESHILFTPSDISENKLRVRTNILRSRCRHTKQKDTGEALIHIKMKNSDLDKISLLKEIISLREVNEFHEFCAEKLFTSLISHPNVLECCVMLMYSRRGSLDINPVRSTSIDIIPLVMLSERIYTKKQMGQ